MPSKIVCGGLNYVGHAREAGLPIPKVLACFFKPPTTIIGHQEAIEYPPQTKRLEYEGELAVVVKRKMRNTPSEEVLDCVLGYSVSKSFDTFNPVGPWLVTDLDPHNLNMTLSVSGKVPQKCYPRPAFGSTLCGLACPVVNSIQWCATRNWMIRGNLSTWQRMSPRPYFFRSATRVVL